MKRVLLFALLLICVTVFSQQQYDSYQASNGKTYKKGDTLTLNIGSGANGRFQYFQVGGWAKGFTMASDANQFKRFGNSDSNPTKLFAGKKIYIKRIEKDKDDRFKFIVTAKKGSNYDLFIEEALQTCEIKDCQSLNNPPPPISTDKYDQLKKIQELKNSGTITEEEFKIEKAKILKN